jgi:hypothetical protein
MEYWNVFNRYYPESDTDKQKANKCHLYQKLTVVLDYYTHQQVSTDTSEVCFRGECVYGKDENNRYCYD